MYDPLNNPTSSSICAQCKPGFILNKPTCT